MGSEISEDWEGVVPDEEGVDLMQVSQTGLIAVWVVQDLQTHPYKFLSLQFNCPLLFRLFGFIVVKIEEPLGLALDAAF